MEDPMIGRAMKDWENVSADPKLTDSQALQETVRTITDLDALSQIINRIFLVTHFDEAKSLIQDILTS